MNKLILPNTLLIGVQKAGTTSIYDWIAQHPAICAPTTVKDFHYFLNEVHYSKGISWLSSFFAAYQNEKIILQGAVNYIYFPQVAERIYRELGPDVKFLLILRNPAKRAWSAYQYFYKNGSENADFRTALSREQTNPYTDVVEKAHFDYIGHGYYFEQISAYLKYFKKEQFKILLYEEVMADKAGVVSGIFDFLGVDPGFQPNFSQLNITGKARSRWLNRLLFGNSGLKKILRTLNITNLIPRRGKVFFSNFMRRANTSVASAGPGDKMPEEVYHELMGNYKEDIARLSVFLGKDLGAIWKY
jgi:hypothetical protein